MQLEYKSESPHKGHLAVTLGHSTRFYTNGKKIKSIISNIKKFLNGYGMAIVKYIKCHHFHCNIWYVFYIYITEFQENFVVLTSRKNSVWKVDWIFSPFLNVIEKKIDTYIFLKKQCSNSSLHCASFSNISS